jgi:hypothetical protein
MHFIQRKLQAKVTTQNSSAVDVATVSTIDGAGRLLNTGRGMASALLELAFNDQRNHPDAIKRRKDRLQLADLTKEVDSATRKLTSGTAFGNNWVALHGDHVWEHQQKWLHEKEVKEKGKHDKRKELFWEGKNCDEIQKRNREQWTINNIQTLLTYKK